MASCSERPARGDRRLVCIQVAALGGGSASASPVLRTAPAPGPGSEEAGMSARVGEPVEWPSCRSRERCPPGPRASAMRAYVESTVEHEVLGDAGPAARCTLSRSRQVEHVHVDLGASTLTTQPRSATTVTACASRTSSASQLPAAFFALGLAATNASRMAGRHPRRGRSRRARSPSRCGLQRDLVRRCLELRRALLRDVARDPFGVSPGTPDEHRRERVQERQAGEVQAG